ncbi:hypothetical protein [Nocardia sp. NPDC051832]|uniref:hypothetical protein n=1 Tax=Nocardia sp. NPDC051832 TaxID=3155673 RepID=UPI00342B6CDF
MTIEEDKTRWSYLASEAKAGRLYLDQSVAKDCRDACNKQISLYESLISKLDVMKRVTGFGRFDCSDDLAAMLGQKARGGEGDVYTALMEHISVITLIRDTIQVSVDKYEAQDTTNAGEQDKLLN